MVLNASFRAERKIIRIKIYKLEINKDRYKQNGVEKGYTTKKTCSISGFLRVFTRVRFHCLAIHAKAAFKTVSSFYGAFAFSTEKTSRLVHPPFVRRKR